MQIPRQRNMQGSSRDFGRLYLHRDPDMNELREEQDNSTTSHYMRLYLAQIRLITILRVLDGQPFMHL